MQLTSSKILVAVQFITSAYIVLSGKIWLTNPGLVTLAAISVLNAAWAIRVIQLKHLKISPEINPANALVTHGPYKWIRHPMYTSLLLVTFCFILNDFSWMRLAVWSALFVNLLIKISVEEKLLRNHYSDYSKYQSKTKKLFPFIL